MRTIKGRLLIGRPDLIRCRNRPTEIEQAGRD
jgi:hypothetical protein